jgi:SAM-dependent MidA family methyltransferase
MQLPLPDPIALQHSHKLSELIRQEMQQAGGRLSFARFMELALYAPGLGYYSAGQHKLGAGGDFVTAPEISPLFARSIARQCQQVLTEIAEGEMLELGAGSGVFAKDILLELEKLNVLPVNYYILETSADLRERQQQLFEKYIPHLLNRIHWLNVLPEKKINGIIFANEVLDALPTHLFMIDENELGKERCVVWENDRFVWQLTDPTMPVLREELEKLKQNYQLPAHYQSEINLMQPAWVNSMVACLNSGIILLLDYGYGGAEYYHPDRTMGTLMCYYQHRKHDNPLDLVGLQDVTAHVDFTRLIENVNLAECSLAGFTTQADFLLACGLLTLAEQENITDPLQQYKLSQVIKKLILPGEMGEIVKVMALRKNFSAPLLGFLLNDRRRDL